MKSIESSAKTIEDAIRQGLEKLDVSLGDVTIDIIQEGSKGLFGIMGAKEAKVRLTVRESEQEGDILSAFSAPADADVPQEEEALKQPKKKQHRKKAQQTQAEPAEKPVKAAPVVKESR
ncbi:MAG: Jag N-terminal domain-containing protein, partial [Bacillota bacterium]